MDLTTRDEIASIFKHYQIINFTRVPKLHKNLRSIFLGLGATGYQD